MGKKITFYAVKVGRVPGIYKTWEECSQQVSEFSGAIYKGFNTEIDALNFISNEEHAVPAKKDDNPCDELFLRQLLDDYYIIAFTDGSYDKTQDLVSYGIVYITDSKFNQIVRGNFMQSKVFNESMNITGELQAVVEAMEYALGNGYLKLAVFHDLEGVSKWASGEWKANTKVTKYFKRKFDELSELIEVTFYKVKAHSGCKYNEQADNLANEALKSKRKIHSKGDNFFTLKGLSSDEFEAFLNKASEKFTHEYFENSNNKRYIFTLDSEKITITWFMNKTLLIQGKQKNLYYELIAILLESSEEILDELFNVAFSKPVKTVQSEMDDYYAAHLSKLPINFSTNMKQIIMMGIFFVLYDVPQTFDGYDYGHFTIPTFRGLESLIKARLIDIGVPMTNPKGNFEMFKPDSNGNYKFLVKHDAVITDLVLKNKIEEAYTYFNQNRHFLTHSGEVLAIDNITPKKVSSYSDAKKIIEDTIAKMNSLY